MAKRKKATYNQVTSQLKFDKRKLSEFFLQFDRKGTVLRDLPDRLADFLAYFLRERYIKTKDFDFYKALDMLQEIEYYVDGLSRLLSEIHESDILVYGSVEESFASFDENVVIAIEVRYRNFLKRLDAFESTKLDVKLIDIMMKKEENDEMA